jgi:hypothetical protein
MNKTEQIAQALVAFGWFFSGYVVAFILVTLLHA